MKKTIFLALFLFSILSYGFGQDITGTWYGFLELPGGKLRIVFHISEKEGVYHTTMDSPDQGAKDIPTAGTTLKNADLDIQIPNLKAKYAGTVSGTEIKGTFTQFNSPLPLNLSREEIKAERPQEPRPPYPYYTEDVNFSNAKAEISLAGTLTLPRKDGVFPAVVLISGSGAQNRDEELAGHKPFLVIADYLTRQGIAVLRVDDRGTGQSTGNFDTGTSEDFATDVEAAVNYLRKRKEILKSQIGLIGHSEGGMIAPMVAAKDKNIAFIVLLAGPGIPNRQLMRRQINDILAAQGVNEGLRTPIVECTQKAYQIMEDYPGESAKPRLEEFFRANIQTLFPGKNFTQEQQKQIVDEQVNTYLRPWYRFFVQFDPSGSLEKVKCPVLAMNGEKDLQVNASENLAGISQALAKAGNKSFKIVSLPGLNHLFQESTTGSPNEYGVITQTFSPKALKVMSDWISEQTKK